MTTRDYTTSPILTKIICVKTIQSEMRIILTIYKMRECSEWRRRGHDCRGRSTALDPLYKLQFGDKTVIIVRRH